MNAKSLTLRLVSIATLAAAAGAAGAQEIIVPADDFVPMLTREQVRAEVLELRAAGQRTPDDESASAMSQFPAEPSTNAREPVRAELREAREARAETPMIYNPAA